MKKYAKVIIWGYPITPKPDENSPNPHTHSYIHAAFYKAFKHLGYEVHWFNDTNHPQGFDYSNCLFFASSTEQCQYLPIEATATYILHNADGRKYHEAGCKIMFMQVYTKDLYNNNAPENLTKIHEYSIFAKGEGANCLYMPWATDLLPHEIKLDNATNASKHDYPSARCVWIGSYGGNVNDPFQNGSELLPYFNACQANGIEVYRTDPWAKPITFEENMQLIRTAYLAPAINGKWQKDQHYVPCRAFKNVSYGHFCITNNAFLHQIFGDAVVYDDDTKVLFEKSIAAKQQPDAIDAIKWMMQKVASEHTFINRIEDLLIALEM